MQRSPYTPGRVANDLPGRAEQLARFEQDATYMVELKELAGRLQVEYAPRGVGKTSLLRGYERIAHEKGIATAWVTAGEDAGLITQIAEGITHASQNWRAASRKAIASHVESVTISAGVPGVAQASATLRPAAAGAPSGTRDFERLISAAATAGDTRGLMVFIDEIQVADAAGLRTLAYSLQHMQSEAPNVPFGVFAAGLPNSPDAIGKVVTFSERFDYRAVDPLEPGAQALALVAPASKLGVQWEPDAVAAAVQTAAGYPYTLQLIADATWRAAGSPDPGASINVGHVEAGEVAIQQNLQALYRARWASATERERQLMSAMADLSIDDAPVSRAAVAAAMGVDSRALGTVRQTLLDKGFIQSEVHGQLEFTMPGFAQYVREANPAGAASAASLSFPPASLGRPESRRAIESPSERPGRDRGPGLGD